MSRKDFIIIILIEIIFVQFYIIDELIKIAPSFIG